MEEGILVRERVVIVNFIIVPVLILDGMAFQEFRRINVALILYAINHLTFVDT